MPALAAPDAQAAPPCRLARPGNNFCTRAAGPLDTVGPQVCIDFSNLYPDWPKRVAEGWQFSPGQYPDRWHTNATVLKFCVASASVQLPACTAAALAGGGWYPPLAALAAGGVALLALAAAALVPPVLRCMTASRRQRGLDEEGVQLLWRPASSDSGGRRQPTRREHAEIERQLRSLRERLAGVAGAAGDHLVVAAWQVTSWQHAAEASSSRMPNPFSHATDPLRSAVTFGPLPLRLTDLTFCQPGSSGSGSGSGDAGLVAIGAGTSSKVGVVVVLCACLTSTL